MTRGYIGRRRDANQGEIVAALQGVGAQVYDAAKHGTPFDIIIFWRGITMLVEIKRVHKLRGAGAQRKLTVDEVAIHELARSRGCVIPIVETVEQALALLGAKTSA